MTTAVAATCSRHLPHHLQPLGMHFSHQCMPATPPHAAPHSPAVVCRGGALCTLSAFDIAQQVDHIFAEPVPAGWKTQAKPTVTAFAWASPRVGNYSFLKVRPMTTVFGRRANGRH